MSINATLLIQIVAFLLLIWFVNKVLWNPLSKLMEDRQKKISDGLSAADKGRLELEMAEQRAKEALKEVKSQAKTILMQAEKRGSEIVEDAKVQANEESERIKLSAKTELEQEISRAKETLRKEVASLVVQGAEKILRKEIKPATHNDMLESLVKTI